MMKKMHLRVSGHPTELYDYQLFSSVSDDALHETDHD